MRGDQMALTWDELLVQNISHEQFGKWIAPWNSVIGGRISPMFMSMFGTWFLLRPKGHVEMFDVFSGELQKAADSHEQFVGYVNELWWQETYLLSEHVYQLRESGKIPGPE